MRYRIISRIESQGVPPPCSYWIGLDRTALAAAIAARRHQQAPATLKDVRSEPAVAATVELMLHKVRARLAKQRTA